MSHIDKVIELFETLDGTEMQRCSASTCIHFSREEEDRCLLHNVQITKDGKCNKFQEK